MFKFVNPIFLLGLVAAIVLLGWFLYNEFRRNRQMKAFGSMKVLSGLMPTRSLFRQRLKFALSWIALVALSLVAARIQFVVDVSNSMLCTDESPSRLEKAKMILNAFLDNSENTKLGLVAFAGTSVTRMPITSDLGSAKMFVNSLSTEDVSVQGTAIGAALRQAQRCFSKDEGVARCILLLTDAENHEDDAVATAEAVNRDGHMLVDVVGLGSKQGSTIVVGDSLLISAEGDTVISRFDENLAKSVAKAGKGLFIAGTSPAKVVKQVMAQLDKEAGNASQVSKSAVSYTDKFFVFAIVAFVCLLADIVILERKSRFIDFLSGLFKKKSAE